MHRLPVRTTDRFTAGPSGRLRWAALERECLGDPERWDAELALGVAAERLSSSAGWAVGDPSGALNPHSSSGERYLFSSVAEARSYNRRAVEKLGLARSVPLPLYRV